MNPAWNFQEIVDTIGAWLEKPQNQQRMEQDTRSALNAFLQRAGTDVRERSKVPQRLRQLALWTRNVAVREILDGNPTGETHLRTACMYDVLRVVWMGALLRNRPSKNTQAAFYLSGVAITLAQCYALGATDEGDRFGKLVLEGLSAGWIAEEPSPVGTLTLGLFGQWRGEPVDADPDILGDYSSLLKHWADPDTIQFQRAVRRACEYHTDLSGDLDDETDYDFSEEAFRIYPVEVLAAVRMRQARGLSADLPSHELLDSPLGTLPPARPLVRDELVTRLLNMLDATEI